MFQVNDMVLYGTNGVCELVGIEKRDCGGRMVEYYILKPFYTNNSTVFVPVNNKKLTSKMRHVLTKEEIDQMIAEIPGNPSALLEHQREVMERGKKLHIADERMLREAEKMICDEFAYVLGISQEEVPAYITSGLENAVK